MDFSTADRLMDQNAPADAHALLEGMLAARPGEPEVLKRLVDAASAMQDPGRALAWARQLVAGAGADLDARFYLAKAEFQNGDAAAALAIVESMRGTDAEQSSTWHYFRGNVHMSRNELPAAADAYAAAVALDPGYADAWLQLATASYRQGDVARAEQALDRATTLEPRRAKAWATQGVMFAETFQFERARQSLERALALAPDNEPMLDLLGFVLGELGETERAGEVLAMPPAAGQRKAAARILREALRLPQVYASLDDARAWRERYVARLTALAGDTNDWCPHPQAVFSFTQSNFLLAYQGENDRALQTTYADMVRGLIAQARPDLLERRAPRAARSRIKVVYVSSFFRDCTVGKYFRGWIADLDPARFERVVIHTGWQLDAWAQALAAVSDRVVVSRGGPTLVAEEILAENADILIFPEVGMGARNYLLANMRLAPVQIAGWGHPVTTGSAEIDYFLSCAAMEPADAPTHYRERLLLLPGIGTSYAAPAPGPAFARKALGVADDRRLYAVPQSLFKIHPENDDLYLDLMARDERAVLLFFQGVAPAIDRAFAARLSARMAARGMPARGQMKFLPRMDERSFRAVLAAVDVVLDTLRWSGGNTSLDALSAGAPIVTLPGEFMRGRQTAAMLRTLDADELIAADRADYLDKAVALAADPEARAGLREKILGGRDRLFGRPEPIRALAEHLENVHAAARG